MKVIGVGGGPGAASILHCALVPPNITLSNFYLHRQYWLEGDFPVKAIDKGSTSVSPCSIP